jgi:hypothetical protein
LRTWRPFEAQGELKPRPPQEKSKDARDGPRPLH